MVHYTDIVSVDYAEIPILDFGLLDLPRGKEKLVVQLKEAVEQTGMSITLLAFLGEVKHNITAV